MKPKKRVNKKIKDKQNCRTKSTHCCHMNLMKLATFFFTLFLITAWPGFRNFVMRFGWYWYLIITIIFVIPIFKTYKLK